MSHANASIRFTDGEVWYAEYDGTGDIILPAIWRTADERNAAWRTPENWRDCTCGTAPEPAEYVNDYGGGAAYMVTACRACGAIVDRPFPGGDDDVEEIPIPAWARTHKSLGMDD